MIITIKVLKGDEVEIEVPEVVTIHEIKQKLRKQLNIPISHQKLLFCGRTLADERTLGSYNSGTKYPSKLTLVVKEPEQIKDVMYKIFRKYCTDEQAEHLAQEFVKDFLNRIDNLSLDDIERLATYFLERDRRLYGDSITTESVTGTPTPPSAPTATTTNATSI